MVLKPIQATFLKTDKRWKENQEKEISKVTTRTTDLQVTSIGLCARSPCHKYVAPSSSGVQACFPSCSNCISARVITTPRRRHMKLFCAGSFRRFYVSWEETQKCGTCFDHRGRQDTRMLFHEVAADKAFGTETFPGITFSRAPKTRVPINYFFAKIILSNYHRCIISAPIDTAIHHYSQIRIRNKIWRGINGD